MPTIIIAEMITKLAKGLKFLNNEKIKRRKKGKEKMSTEY
jgi:hypothetical protein